MSKLATRLFGFLCVGSLFSAALAETNAGKLNGGWRQVTPIGTPRYGNLMVPLSNRRMLTLGGSDGSHDFSIPSGEIFDLQAGPQGAWSTTPALAMKTTLSASLSPGAATAYVVSTAGFLPEGSLHIDDEGMTYSGITGTSFLNLKRGTTEKDNNHGNHNDAPTVAASHAAGAAVGPGWPSPFGGAHWVTTLRDGRILVSGGSIPVLTVLAAQLMAGEASSATVESTADFPSSGILTIEQEQVRYTGKTAKTFTGLTRGVNSTAKADHAVKLPVSTDHAGSSYLYDPAHDSWSRTGDMPNATCSCHVMQRGLLLEDGRVFIAGGLGPSSFVDDVNNPAGVSGTSMIFDPTVPDGNRMGKWTSSGDMVAPVFNFSWALLRDGRVLVVGGAGVATNWNPFVYAEENAVTSQIWNPATGAWSAGPQIPAVPEEGDDPGKNLRGRSEMGSASQNGLLLPDGRVLIAGGDTADSTGLRTSAFLFDPATNTWSRTRNDLKDGSGYIHFVRQMGGDRVFLVGGDTANGPTVNSYVFDPLLDRFHPIRSLPALHTHPFGIQGPVAFVDQFGSNADALDSGEVLLVGGVFDLSTFESPTPRCQLYDPAESEDEFWQ